MTYPRRDILMMTLGGFVFGRSARDLSLWHEHRTGQSVKDWITEQELRSPIK